MVEVNVGWRKKTAEETGAQEKETGKEVGLEREGALRTQPQERDWHWKPAEVGSAGKWTEWAVTGEREPGKRVRRELTLPGQGDGECRLSWDFEYEGLFLMYVSEQKN